MPSSKKSSKISTSLTSSTRLKKFNKFEKFEKFDKFDKFDQFDKFEKLVRKYAWGRIVVPPGTCYTIKRWNINKSYTVGKVCLSSFNKVVSDICAIICLSTVCCEKYRLQLFTCTMFKSYKMHMNVKKNYDHFKNFFLFFPMAETRNF